MSDLTPRQTCPYCRTMLYERRENGVKYEGLYEADTCEHDLGRCREVCAARIRQLEHGRGAGYCGYQWGMGAQNHGGGCEVAFEDCEEVYRCLTCGGVFHKKCLQRHFEKHSGATPEAERARIVTWLRECQNRADLAAALEKLR